MHISAHLGLPPGHSHFPFVDITTRSDTRLFLDPCLIERSQDDFSRYAAALISDFEDKTVLGYAAWTLGLYRCL